MCYTVRMPERLDTRLLAYLAANPRRRISQAEVCEHLGLVPWELWELCREVLGCPLLRYVSQKRVESAARMLVEKPHLSVSQVSKRHGWTDNGLESAMLAHLGFTPKGWRCHVISMVPESAVTAVIRERLR